MRIGLLAASRIATRAIVAPARANARVEVGAVGARSSDAAEAFAAGRDIPVAYGSYEDLLADDALDTIYVSTPPSLHARWTIAALEAGKHVLCEKPIAGNAADARRMFETAERTGKVLMEAFHWRFHPFATRMIERFGALSGPVSLEAEFSIPHMPKTDIRYQPSLGGGALMDLGCYPIHWARTLLGEPDTVEAEMESTVEGIDDTTVGSLAFPDGSRARIRTSMTAPGVVWMLRATGTNGWVHAENPIHPSEGNRLAWTLDGSADEEEVGGPVTFEAQLSAFVERVEDGGPQVVTARDSIGNMEVIDAMYRSAGFEPRP